MALLDIFKKKKKKKEIKVKEEVKAEKKEKKIKEEKIREKKPEKILKEEKRTEKTEKTVPFLEEKIKTPQKTSAYKVLKYPHISEKASFLAEKNQYAFEIYPGANKREVKKAVEDIYKVDVEKVRIIKVPKKPRRLGRQTGWKGGYKKAIVKLKEGQKIEIMPR